MDQPDPTPAAPVELPPVHIDGEDLESRRAAAATSRAKFCLALMDAGILTEGEAEIAARGEWPASFADALAFLPANIPAARAKVVWAGVGEVRRTDPVLLAVQAYKGLTDAQVDALFGI